MAVLACCALLVGCTTVRSIPTREIADFNQVIKVGDTVDCGLRDGSRKRFRVTRVEPTTIAGQNNSVAVADLTDLTVERVSVGKTTLLVVGGIVIVAAIAAAASPRPNTPFHALGEPR